MPFPSNKNPLSDLEQLEKELESFGKEKKKEPEQEKISFGEKESFEEGEKKAERKQIFEKEEKAQEKKETGQEPKEDFRKAKDPFEEQVERLLMLARKKGVSEAVKEAQKINDPFVLDAFHDRLSREGF